MKTLIILPTFNEASNITSILRQLHEQYPEFDILHIDDNSPDRTAEIALEFGLENYRQIRNFNKLGLGSAYKQGFRWALDKNYEAVITMDSDGSHKISQIGEFLRFDASFDLIIGTRWMTGGEVINWPIYRRAISKFGTWYASKALSLPFADLTSGFRLYKCDAIRSIDFSTIDAKGYVFQIQMVDALYKNKARILEMPITFTERASGTSKMSGKIAREAFLWISKAWFKRR